MSGELEPRRARALARKDRQDAELASDSDSRIYRHHLAAWEKSQIDRIDSMTTKEAVQAAFDEEVSFFDHGLAKANGSAVKQQLLADKLEALASINNHRLMRKFSRP